MGDWSPAAYERFADERARPFVDLLDLLPPRVHGRMIDLGCGDGRLTRLAAARLGVSGFVGVDTSRAMLEVARTGTDDVPAAWREADLRDALAEPERYALVLSNAALQFVPRHDVVFPALLDRVAPGGWVAVHMPYNHVARSHLLMETAAEAVRDALGGLRVEWPQEDPDVYASLLRGAGFDHVLVQIRVYRHPLDGAQGIVAWMRSAGMKPWLDRLDDDHQAAFLRAYERLIDVAYPPVDGDTRLLDYARLLIVGRRPPG
ncbi:MAG TPA: methyltransferase domain-containing protein [Myxococcota bacterium]|nr:methyltransferase domain-containing protein [Myxococcota bacterium]